jgi:hypothetical protein
MGMENIPAPLLKTLKLEASIELVKEEGDILILLDADSLDIGLVFPNGFYTDSSFHKPINAYYNSGQNGQSAEAVLSLIEDYEDLIVAAKIQKMDMNPNILDPIVVEETNTFNPLVLMGKVMEQIKGVVSNILNLIFILFVIWLTRNLILRGEFVGKHSFKSNLFVIWMATMLAMAFVFIGFQLGVNTEGEGMVRSVILSIQQLLVWNKLSSILWLWWPTWLFIIGLIGCIASGSRRTFSAYSRTFWAVAIIHAIALIGLIPIEKMGWIHTCLPVLNVFGVGQLSMKGLLGNSNIWMTAMVATTFWAVVINYVWYRIKESNVNVRSKKGASEIKKE